MVENWDQTRRDLPDGQAVMITDASNKERDQMNALAQERRAQAGELGADRVELPDKPYGLAAGDEVIFTAQFYPPGQKRIENGITGTVIDTSPDQDKVTIRTKEREPREVQVDTSKFSDLSLAYAVHVNKAQGITAETCGILIGGWQTDREHAYVAVSRAREQTQIYVSREDLGEQGLDTGAIERLAERMAAPAHKKPRSPETSPDATGPSTTTPTIRARTPAPSTTTHPRTTETTRQARTAHRPPPPTPSPTPSPPAGRPRPTSARPPPRTSRSPRKTSAPSASPTPRSTTCTQ